MEIQDNPIFKKMMEEREYLELENAKLQKQYAQQSMFSGDDNDNLIKWQLGLNEELERIEHLLKGHTLKRNKDGQLEWADAKDDDLRPFNEKGADTLMKIISSYLNRNTILSNYSEEWIDKKMRDLGDEINDLIYMNYYEMGMNTDEKRKQYPMIVRELIDIIHSAYLRALRGGERESLRTARHVSQTDNSAMMGGNPQGISTTKRSIIRPNTWMKL